MAAVWYYAELEGEKLFVAYNDIAVGSTRRLFAACDGTYLDLRNSTRSFADVFKRDLISARRLGELQSRPNLGDAAKNGRLPDSVLSELKSLLKTMHGIAVPYRTYTRVIASGSLTRNKVAKGKGRKLARSGPAQNPKHKKRKIRAPRQRFLQGGLCNGR